MYFKYFVFSDLMIYQFLNIIQIKFILKLTTLRLKLPIQTIKVLFHIKNSVLLKKNTK